MKVEHLMTQKVCTCSPAATLEEAARLMWEADLGCLVVTDADQKPLGMITDRDIAMAAYTQGITLRESHVQSAMSKTVLTCTRESPIGEVEALMQTGQIRRVPVVGAGERLVGIVTLGDLARDAESGATRLPALPGLAKTLCAVTTPRAREIGAAAE